MGLGACNTRCSYYVGGGKDDATYSKCCASGTKHAIIHHHTTINHFAPLHRFGAKNPTCRHAHVHHQRLRRVHTCCARVKEGSNKILTDKPSSWWAEQAIDKTHKTQFRYFRTIPERYISMYLLPRDTKCCDNGNRPHHRVYQVSPATSVAS